MRRKRVFVKLNYLIHLRGQNTEISSVGFSYPQNNSVLTDFWYLVLIKSYSLSNTIIQICCMKWNNFRFVGCIKNLSVKTPGRCLLLLRVWGALWVPRWSRAEPLCGSGGMKPPEALKILDLIPHKIAWKPLSWDIFPMSLRWTICR